MRAVTILKEEHTLILDFLDQLTLAGQKLVRDERPAREFFDQAVAFARQFADRFHHHKEEEIMFRVLAQKHDGQLDAELDSLKQQHEHCRNLIIGIADAIEGYAGGSDTQTRAIHRNLTEYIHALRQHIDHENVVFFPKVTRELSADELNLLEQEFLRWDEKTGGKMTDDNRQRLANMTAALTD